MNETVKRILDFMEQKGDNANSLQVKVKLPTGSVFSWKNGKCKPSMDSIIKLATYFNVSADYLLCLSNEPTPLKTVNVSEHPVTTLSAELSQDKWFVNAAKMYRALPDEYRQGVYSYILSIALGLGLNVRKILGR